MGEVAESESMGGLGEGGFWVGSNVRCGVLDAAALDDLVRGEPDVLGTQPMQGSRRDREGMGRLGNRCDGGVGFDDAVHLVGEQGFLGEVAN